MKTYAEINEKTVFDWNAFLNKEEYTMRQTSDAADNASSWVTCACGNVCNALPRNAQGRPLDDELAWLGYDFCAAISEMNHSAHWNNPVDSSNAKTILAKIEERSTYLLKEMGVL